MKNKGFTLIELLVVVSIIGVLSAIVLTSLSSARSKARDSKRVSEVRALQQGLELYYLDYGEYPQISGSNCSDRSNVTWDSLMNTLDPYVGNISSREPYPVCLFYINFNVDPCNAQPDSDYNIIFGATSPGLGNFDRYDAGSDIRYCAYSI